MPVGQPQTDKFNFPLSTNTNVANIQNFACSEEEPLSATDIKSHSAAVLHMCASAMSPPADVNGFFG